MNKIALSNTGHTGNVDTNGIGDCFADGVFELESAYKALDKKRSPKSLLASAKRSIADVADYDYADAKDKNVMSKCLAAVDKAIANPTAESVLAARWECEKARAKYDGGSPQKAFWNSATACNAKFKVGDKVKVIGSSDKSTHIVTWVNKDGSYELDHHDITFYDDDLVAANSRACNSANSVVRKAMNACRVATNGISVGDEVTIGEGYYSGEEGVVVSVSGNEAKVKITTDSKNPYVNISIKDLVSNSRNGSRRVAVNASNSDEEYAERIRRVATEALKEFDSNLADSLKRRKENFCYSIRQDTIREMEKVKIHVKEAKLPDAKLFIFEADAKIKKVEAICAKVNAL